MQIEEIKSVLRERLTEKRYRHSLCVADEAARLAKKYGGDAEKAYLAGLLHDITKNAPREEHLKLFSTFGIMLDDVENNAFKLWHAISGAVYAERILKVEDAEILDAIRYHTTAKADMSKLTLILYLADFTSADREYDDVDIIREKVDRSLEEALQYALQYSITDLVNREKAVHPDTVQAWNEIAIRRTSHGI